jgi:hypothetical protein
LTCSGFDIPKPTATGLVVDCHKKKSEMMDVRYHFLKYILNFREGATNFQNATNQESAL